MEDIYPPNPSSSLLSKSLVRSEISVLTPSSNPSLLFPSHPTAGAKVRNSAKPLRSVKAVPARKVATKAVAEGE